MGSHILNLFITHIIHTNKKYHLNSVNKNNFSPCPRVTSELSGVYETRRHPNKETYQKSRNARVGSLGRAVFAGEIGLRLTTQASDFSR